MIARLHRLPLRSLPLFFLQSRSAHSPSLLVRMKRNDLGYYRFAVIVPKKHIPLATRRNKLKRWITHMLLEIENSHPQTSLDIVVTWKGRDEKKYSKKTITLDLKSVLHHLHSNLPSS